MRLAAYCRVSTDKEEQLESMENQRAFFEEFAQKQGHDLVKIYADEGISGKQMNNRRAFLSLLSDAEQGLFDMVVVKDISRFARNTVDFLNATRQLRSRQIEVQFLSNNQTILGGSEFVLTVFSALAQEESASLSRRVKFGKRMNAKKGRVPNVIYGYDQLDTFTLSINEEEAAVVRRIFSLYRQEGMGGVRIARLLNEEGIPTKKGAQWTSKTIRRMLSNPIYCGVLVNNKSETVDFLTGAQKKLPLEAQFTHARPEYAIISSELFEQTQTIIRQRAAVAQGDKQQRYSGQYLFSTLIRCAHCGYAYSRITYTYRNTFVKWRCAGNSRYSARFCPNNITLDEAELWGQIFSYLVQGIGDRQAFFDGVAAECERRQCRADGMISCEELGEKLTGLASKAEKCKELYISGLIGQKELCGRLARLDEQRQALCDRIAEQEPIESKAQRRARWRARAQELLQQDHWSNADLRQLIEQITVNVQGETVVQLRRLKDSNR